MSKRTKKETQAQAWRRALAEGRVLRFQRADGTFQLTSYPDLDFANRKLLAGLPSDSEFVRVFKVDASGVEVSS